MDNPRIEWIGGSVDPRKDRGRLVDGLGYEDGRDEV